MPGTFTEFVTWPDREEILLAQPRALLTLTGWVGTGGFANTYQVAVTNQTTPPAGHGVLYRRVVGVRENDVELTAQTSVTNVNSNAGSYYWDEAAGLLYVRTTGSAVDPDTKTVVAARVQFFLSTASIVLNATDGAPDTGIFREGRLLDGAGPTIVQEMDDVLSGEKTAWNGDLEVSNADKAWFHLLAVDSGYTFKNQQVAFRFGGRYRGQSLDLSQYQTIGTLLIEDVTADEASCKFLLKPLTRLADLSVPVTPYFETEYPALGDGVRGSYKALLYGRAWTEPKLTSTAGYGTWTIADAAYQNLYAVHAVEAINQNQRVVLTEGQDYTFNLSACTVTMVTDRYPFASWSLRVEATGKTNMHAEGGGGAGMRGYLSTASEIVRDLLFTFGGVKASGIDSTAFTEAHADAPEELAIWIPEPRSLASVFSTSETSAPSIERSVNGIIGQTKAGLWTLKIWDPTYDAATLPVLTKQDLAAFSPSPRLEVLTTSTRVWFNRDGRFDTWSKGDATDLAQQYLTGVTGPPLEVWTFLRAQGDADALAARYQFTERYATVEVDFVERGALLSLTDVGSRVLVTYDPAPDVTGAYTSRAFTLVRVERGYAPRMAVQGTLRDVHRVTNRVGRWKGPSEPNYASASGAQRLLAGYWGASSSPSSSLGWQ